MSEEPKKNSVLDQFQNATSEDLLQLARITENAERYEDMCMIMGSLVRQKADNPKGLEVEERNMLSVAYKNVVGARRASWRTLKQDTDGDVDAKLRDDYRVQVEAELEAKCLEVLNLLKDHLVKQKEAVDALANEKTDVDERKRIYETQVFYLKMCGDYYRYLAEFSQVETYKASAEENYKVAIELSKNLTATHPTRLGLALNASVFYYEILDQRSDACKLAKNAFDEAIQKLDTLNDSSYKDSTLIMQLLRDNLTIWTSEDNNNAHVEENED